MQTQAILDTRYFTQLFFIHSLIHSQSNLIKPCNTESIQLAIELCNVLRLEFLCEVRVDVFNCICICSGCWHLLTWVFGQLLAIQKQVVWFPSSRGERDCCRCYCWGARFESPRFHGIVSHVSFSRVGVMLCFGLCFFYLWFFVMCVHCSSSNKDPGARPADALSLRDHGGGISFDLF